MSISGKPGDANHRTASVGQYRRMEISVSDARLIRLHGVQTVDEARAATVEAICHLFAFDAHESAAVFSGAGLDDVPSATSARKSGKGSPSLADVAYFPADAKQILRENQAALTEIPVWRLRVVPWLNRSRKPSADTLAVLSGRLNELPPQPRATTTAVAIERMARRGEGGQIVSAGFVPQLLMAADHRDLSLFSSAFEAGVIAAGVIWSKPGSQLEIGFTTLGMSNVEEAMFGVPVTLANAWSTVAVLLIGAARVELWDTTGFELVCDEVTWSEYSLPESSQTRALERVAEVLALKPTQEYGNLPGSNFIDGDFFRVDYLRHGDVWSLSAPHRVIAYNQGEWDDEALADVEAFVHRCQEAARSAKPTNRHPFASMPDAMRVRQMPVFDPARLLTSDEAFVLFDLSSDGTLQCRTRTATLEFAASVPLTRETQALLERHAIDRASGVVRKCDGALTLSALIDSLSADMADWTAGLGQMGRLYVSLGRGVTASPIVEVLTRLGIPAVRSVSLALNAATGAVYRDDRVAHCRDGYANTTTARIVFDTASAHPAGALAWAEPEAKFVATWYADCQLLSGRAHVTGAGADVFHFCGHARGNSEAFDNALDLSAEVGGPLTAYELLGGEGVWHSTAFASLNACEAGAGEARSPLRLRSASVAEALLVRGVRWVLAPAWRVGDRFAAVFSAVFHFVFAQERDPYVALWHARRLATDGFAKVAELDSLGSHLDRILGEDWRGELVQQRHPAAVASDVSAFELHERVMLLPLAAPDPVDSAIAMTRQAQAFRHHLED